MSAASNSIQGALTARLFPAGLVAALVGAGLWFDLAESFAVVPQRQPLAVESELAREAASPAVREVVQWAVTTHDHAGFPFVVVDKAQARIYAFDLHGRLRGTAPVAPVLSEGLAPPLLPAGRFTAEPLAAATAPGAVVWSNGATRVAVRADDEAQGPPAAASAAALRVAPEFWHECLAGLRAQPSIAYVLPQSVQAAFLMQAPGMAHEGGPDEIEKDRER